VPNKKEKTLHAVNVRLTDSEYAEYLRLGGIKWVRLFLRQSIEMQAMLEPESYERKERELAKRSLWHTNKAANSGGATKVVAVPKSRWQVVNKITKAREEISG